MTTVQNFSDNLRPAVPSVSKLERFSEIEILSQWTQEHSETIILETLDEKLARVPPWDPATVRFTNVTVLSG
jgi:hypothetical protein